MLQSSSIEAEQRYVLYRFISRCKCTTDLLIKHLTSKKGSSKKSAIKSIKGHKEINIAKEVKDNFVLKNYNLSDSQIRSMEQSISQIIDTHNSGD